MPRGGEGRQAKNRMATENKSTTFEFSYNVSCVKRYTETSTFNEKDVRDWCESMNYTERELPYTIDWDDLTEAEQEAFIDYMGHNYCPSDQMDDEGRNETHDYEGERDYDEDYDDGLPDSVYDEMTSVWNDWWENAGGPAVIERINTHKMEFENDDGVKHTMTFAELEKHKDYEGDDKVWVQYMGETFMGVERYKQIWIKKPIVEVVVIDYQSKYNEAVVMMEALKARMAELEATLEKKNKMIKALTDME
jgi:hypothetical protein